MKMRCILMPYTDFCQNCVLGLQWNMKIKSKVENEKTNKQKTRNDWQIKNMN